LDETLLTFSTEQLLGNSPVFTKIFIGMGSSRNVTSKLADSQRISTAYVGE